jgi:hypothetical protein
MRAHQRGIIFRNPETLGNWLTVRCSAEDRFDPRPRQVRKAAADYSAAEFSGRDRYYGHRRHRDRLRGGRRHLQLPHCKHPRCDRAGRRLICGSVVLLPGERQRSVGAIFFEIGKHEIMLRQQAVAFAEFGRRRILGRQLALGRPSPITLRRRYVICHRSPHRPWHL